LWIYCFIYPRILEIPLFGHIGIFLSHREGADGPNHSPTDPPHPGPSFKKKEPGSHTTVGAMLCISSSICALCYVFRYSTKSTQRNLKSASNVVAQQIFERRRRIAALCGDKCGCNFRQNVRQICYILISSRTPPL